MLWVALAVSTGVLGGLTYARTGWLGSLPYGAHTVLLFACASTTVVATIVAAYHAFERSD